MGKNRTKKNYNRWHREQAAINRSRNNPEAAALFRARLPEIRARLGAISEDLLHDTFLRMTAVYDGRRDFVDQFVAEYHKMARQMAFARNYADDLPLSCI